MLAGYVRHIFPAASATTNFNVEDLIGSHFILHPCIYFVDYSIKAKDKVLEEFYRDDGIIPKGESIMQITFPRACSVGVLLLNRHHQLPNRLCCWPTFDIVKSFRLL